MKLFLTIITLSISAVTSQAQIIGDDAIRKIEEGRVTTLEGEFIAYLSDTIAPDYVTQQLESLGYELGLIDIQPFTIAIANRPSKDALQVLTSKPEILEFQYEPEPVDTSYFRELLISQDLNEESYELALERIIKSQSRERLFIRFQYNLNERSVVKFMTQHRSIAYEIISDFPRTVSIMVEPGTEKDVMFEVEKLPFVEYTALIGVLVE